MPKNKVQDAVFTAIMAIIMVYGMIVYNVALNTGGVSGETFLLALHELPIMAPIAFILEFFVVGKLAKRLAFSTSASPLSLRSSSLSLSLLRCNSYIKRTLA